MIVWAVGESDNRYSTGDFPPTTITVVEVLPDLSTSSILSYPMTFQTDTPTGSSSILPSSSTSSSPISPGTPSLKDTKVFSASPLNTGAIAGLVTACIFTFLIGIFFAIRIWFKKKRVSKLRKTWPRSSVVGIRYGTDAPEASYEPKVALRNKNSRVLVLSVEIPSPHVSVPPLWYNNDAVFQYATLLVSSSPSVFTSPVRSPGSTFLSPYSTTVACTFIPSLPDELTVCVGETLRVLVEYEDGWSLCRDCRGEQGMVPNECLDRSSASMVPLPPKHYRISRSSIRMTSLAQAVRPGR